jgi:hypothetical protein
MYRLNHDNDKAIHAFTMYFNLTQDKDPDGAEDAAAQIEALGGEAPKKKRKKRKRK